MNMFARHIPQPEPKWVPVIKYVNLLLLHSIRSGGSVLELRKSHVLPTLRELFPDRADGEFPQADLPPPAFESVVNRLKVMSGLGTTPSQEPVSGAVQVRADGSEFEIQTEFDETAEDPLCRLTFKAGAMESRR